jgi:hypothetical protein
VDGSVIHLIRNIAWSDWGQSRKTSANMAGLRIHNRASNLPNLKQQTTHSTITSSHVQALLSPQIYFYICNKQLFVLWSWKYWYGIKININRNLQVIFLSTSTLVEAVLLLICSWKVLGSNLYQVTDHRDWRFLWPSSLTSGKFKDVPQIRIMQLPSTSLTINSLLMILLPDVM